MKEPIRIPPFVPCPECQTGLIVEEKFTIDYFIGATISCQHCKKPLVWWDVILSSIKRNFSFFLAFSAIGAQSLAFRIPLEPGKREHLKFSDYGIPLDAKLLYINYTSYSNGGSALLPLEVHGGVPIRHLIPNEIFLYPMPLGQGEVGKDCGASILVTWVPYVGDGESWQNLVDAFEAYGQGRYIAEIIPANVAVESKLSLLLKSFLVKFASKDNVENFLENAATYGHQLNIVLPLVTSTMKLPRLPDHIRGLLNRLRDLRNQLAHDGKLERPLEQNEASDLICAALFGFRYLGLIYDKLLANPNAGAALDTGQLSQTQSGV